MGIRHWGWGVRVSSKLHCARLCSIYWPPWPLTRFNGWDFNTVTGAWLIMGWELVYRGRGKKHLNYKCIAAPLYFSEIWIGNIVHGGNPLYGVEDCFRHSRGLEWSIWTKCFACGNESNIKFIVQGTVTMPMYWGDLTCFTATTHFVANFTILQLLPRPPNCIT